MTARKKSLAAQRITRLRLGECEPGDVLYIGEKYFVSFGLLGGHGFVNEVAQETFREIGKPKFLDPDTEVEIVRRGVERHARAMAGGEFDPLRGGEKS